MLCGCWMHTKSVALRSTLAMFLEAVEIGWCTQLWLVLSHMCDQHTCVQMRFGVSFFVVHKIMFSLMLMS